MIEINVKTDGKRVLDSIDIDEPTLKECALVVFRLDQIKQDLLSREFKSDFEVREGDLSDV